MEILKALVRDLLNRLVWLWWLEASVRSVPGEFGVALRRWIMGRRLKRKGKNLTIYSGVIIVNPDRMEVGDNCRLGHQNFFQASGGIELGNDVICGPSVKVWSLNHQTANVEIPIWEQGFEYKKVVIGDGVWIGANAFIMPGAQIGDHAVISAGAVVSGKPVEPYSILAGNPARKIGSRLRRQVQAVSEES